jgi:hypothetical protein
MTPNNSNVMDSELEQILFEASSSIIAPKTIFIVGAPRTGSTLLFQVMASSFSLPFLSNLTNTFYPKNPIIGLAIQHGLQFNVKTKSSYGKTIGGLQPSEGSAVLSEWFGGGHPSQDKSFEIKGNQEYHFIKTLATAEDLYNGAPLLIKNAWNCFRISYLAKALPEAKFIWIRRDILDAAESDLEARYTTKQSPYEWNSATPSNFDELKPLPPCEQVIENQYEFNKAIKASLSEVNPNQKLEVWYENLILDTQNERNRISEFLGINSLQDFPKLNFLNEVLDNVSAMESREMRNFMKSHSRFDESRYKNRTG